MSRWLTVLIILLLGVQSVSAQTQPSGFQVFDEAPFHAVVPPGAKLQKLAGGMQFTEGPVWSNQEGGFLLLSDQPADAMMRWSPTSGLSVFRQPSNHCNGNTRDRQGRLVTCEQALRRVAVTEPDGTERSLADHFDGKRFNSPNDVIVKSDGTVWFSDPPYAVPKGQQRELNVQAVFCVDPANGRVQMVRSDFDMPNGLCFTPDESKLYIADSGKPHHVRIFDVTRSADGWSLSGGAVFAVIHPGVPDGMRVDERGNLLTTAGDGIHIYSPDGKLLGKILVPETPANCCFGGPDGHTLFITARTSLYSIDLKVGSCIKR